MLQDALFVWCFSLFLCKLLFINISGNASYKFFGNFPRRHLVMIPSAIYSPISVTYFFFFEHFSGTHLETSAEIAFRELLWQCLWKCLRFENLSYENFFGIFFANSLNIFLEVAIETLIEFFFLPLEIYSSNSLLIRIDNSFWNSFLQFFREFLRFIFILWIAFVKSFGKSFENEFSVYLTIPL